MAAVSHIAVRVPGLALLQALLLTACAASVPYPQLASTADLDYGRAERYVVVEGERIAYEEHGDPHGQVLLLIHCWAGSMRVWDALLPHLAPYHVVLVDLPGHGKSDKPDIDYDVEVAASAVAGLIDQLGLRDLTLVGNSLGGGTALAVVRLRPDRVARLVLVDPLGGGPIPGFFGFFIQQFFTAALFAGADDGLVELFSNTYVFARETQWTEAFLADLLATRAAREDGWAYARAVASYLRSAVDYDASPWLPAIAVPTLVVRGDSDWVIWQGAAEHLVANTPGAQGPVLLEDCGHMPEVECPEALLSVLDDFLPSTPAPPSP